MDTCGICCDTYNKSTRKPIECPYCNNVLCRECVMAYYTSNNEEMHCMSCKKVWLDEFIQDQFHKTTYNRVYKTHQTQLFLEREKSLLPSTQNAVQTEIRRRDNERQVSLISTEINEIETEQRNLVRECNRLKSPYINHVDIIGKCTMDGCKGYIQSDTNKCGLCNKAPENIANSTTLRCNICHKLRYKDPTTQKTWCFQCRKVISAPAQINMKYLNPYFGIFLRDTINDVKVKFLPPYSNRFITKHNLYALINNSHSPVDDKYHEGDSPFYDFLSKIPHALQDVKNNIYQDKMSITIQTTSDHEFQDMKLDEEYRIMYMNDMITEEEWINKLQLKLKRNEARKKNGQLMLLYINVCTFLLQLAIECDYKECNGCKDETWHRLTQRMNIIIDEMIRLRHFVNNEFDKVNGTRYGIKKFRIWKNSWRLFKAPINTRMYVNYP